MPFFYTLKGLSNKRQLFFYFIGTLKLEELKNQNSQPKIQVETVDL